ncbi:MAG: DNA-binding protein [Candidatus Methanomethylicaceae archaeon]
MSDEDSELAAIKFKKMLKLQRRHAAMQQKSQAKPEVDDLTLVRSKLTDRGPEVLDAALSQYPEATREIIGYLAKLYRSGKLSDTISGEELYGLFYDLGMRVRLETTITYIKDGKRVSLSERFRRRE